jgi:hypothetical protein
MVSSSHEATHRIFQEDPKMLARTFKRLGYAFPNPGAVTVLPTEPPGTLLQCDVDRGTGYLLAIESLREKDPEKHATWAFHVTGLYERYGMPPILVVVCPDEATARWAGAPHHVGVAKWRTMTVRPIVLGPHNVPVVTDPAEAAADLPLASFAAIAHRDHPDGDILLKSLATALRQADSQTAGVFEDFTEAALADTPAADTWRSLMANPPPPSSR